MTPPSSIPTCTAVACLHAEFVLSVPVAWPAASWAHVTENRRHCLQHVQVRVDQQRATTAYHIKGNAEHHACVVSAVSKLSMCAQELIVLFVAVISVVVLSVTVKRNITSFVLTSLESLNTIFKIRIHS